MNNVLLFIGGLLVAALAALFAVPHFIDWNGYRGVFEEEASRVLGREVRVGGAVNLRLLPTPYMRFEKVRIADTTGATGEPLFRTESFTAWLSVAPLLQGVLEAREVELRRPELHVGIDAAGRPSWGTFSVSPGSLAFLPNDVTLQSVEIVDGVLGLRGPEGAEIARVGAINGEFAADAIDGPYKFNGTVDWQGSPREVKLATAAQDPDGGLRFKASVRAPATQNHYVLDGRAADIKTKPRIEAELTAKISVGKVVAPTATARPKAAPGEAPPADKAAVPAPPPATPSAEHPTFDLKAMINGGAAGIDVKDIALTFEQAGQPQIVSGEAKASWGKQSRLDLALGSRWLDLDRLAGGAEGAGPLEIARRLATSLAALLPHETAASVRFTVDQVSLGGEAVSGLKAAIVSSGGPLELKELVAGLPGGARLELGGILTPAAQKQAAPGFSGTLALRGSSLARFLSWATKKAAPVEGRSDGPFSLQGRLALGDRSVELTEAMAELAGTPLTGEVRYSQEGRQRIAVSLDGQDIDAAVFLTRGTSLEDVRTILLGGPATAPDGGQREAGNIRWFDPASSDLHLRLRAAQLKLSANVLRDVVADISIDGGRLTVPGLSFATENGLSIEVDGDVTGVAAEPRGRINWLASAPTAEALEDLAELLGFADEDGLDEARVASLVPLRLAGHASFGERVAGAADLDFDGVVQGGRAVASVRLDGGYTGWRGAPAEVLASVDSADVQRLLGTLLARKAGALQPQPGRVNFRAAGVPARGLLTLAGVEADGLSLGYDGLLGLPAEGVRELTGRLRIEAKNAGDVLALAGIGAGGATGLPLDGTLEVSSREQTYTLRPQALAIGGTPVSGQIALSRLPGKTPHILADLKAGEASVTGLLAAVLERSLGVVEEELAAEAASVWPARAFDLSLLDSVEGQITLSLGTLSLDGPLALTDARLEATLSPTQIKVTRLDGRALGGSVSSTFSMDRAPAGIGLSGNLRMEGLRLEALAPPGEAPRASGGPASVSLTFSGRALSPNALIGSLKGQGAIELGAARIKGLTPRSVAMTTDAVLAGRAEPAGEGLLKALSEALHQGDLAVGPRRMAVVIADGALRVEAFAVESEDGRTRVETTVDLTSLKVDSEWRLEPKARGRAPHTSLPSISVVYVGELKTLATLEPRISAGPLERELSVRKMEHEVDQLEKLRKLDEERRIRDLERRNAIEQARPVAQPPLVPPSAGAPLSGPSAAVPPAPPPSGVSLPAPQADATPATEGAPDQPRPSGLTQSPPAPRPAKKDPSTNDIFKKAFGF